MGIQESNSNFFNKTSRESPLQKDTKCSFCDTIFLKNSNYGIFAKHLKLCATSNSKLKEQQQNDSTSCGTENDFELIFACGENEDFFEQNQSKSLPFENKRADLWNKVLEIKGSRPSNVKVIDISQCLTLEAKMDLIESLDIFDNILFSSEGKSQQLGNMILISQSSQQSQSQLQSMTANAIQQQNSQFLNMLLREIIKENKQNLINQSDMLYFNYKNKDEDSMNENVLRLIGKIIAKIILDNSNLEIFFNIGIIKLIIEEYITFDDLENISPNDYYYLKRLQASLDIIDNDQDQDQDKDKDKGLDQQDIFFTAETSKGNIMELIPNGKEIKVNKNNLPEYISLYTKFITSTYESWTYHLRQSLYEYIPKETITQFTPKEFELVLNGSNYIKLNDWKRHTQYHGEFNEAHPTIELFWSFLGEVNQRYLRNSLRVLTESDEVPSDLIELFTKIKFVISSRPWENLGMQVIRNPGKSVFILLLPAMSHIDDIKRAFDSFDVK